MKIFLKPKISKNYIATLAIGKKYFNMWLKHAYPQWRAYCKKYDIGLIIFQNHLLDKSHPKWKKATWQKMLIGQALRRKKLKAKNICYLDTDILISPIAKNIFANFNEKKIGLVSARNNLPFDLNSAQKRLAFFRHNFYNKKYPLDSSLFISCERLYQYHNLSPQKDEACMGLILFNLKNHASIMEKWFYKYDKKIKTITNGGDQTHYNYEILKFGKVQWLSYKFQAIWPYEMAMYYPFLYLEKNKSSSLLSKKCIEATLTRVYFLHFPGSWHESKMWLYKKKSTELLSFKIFRSFSRYLSEKAMGRPKGFIKP